MNELGGPFMFETHFSFEEILEQNERRIHYQINQLHIRDVNQEYYSEGLVALWNAYKTYKPDKGPMATYFNYTIRNRLIDQLRKERRRLDVQEFYLLNYKSDYCNGNHQRNNSGNNLAIRRDAADLVEDNVFWEQLKANLTANQWKWIYFHIMDGMTLTDIAIQENTTLEAVKSWGKQVRKKLRNEAFRKKVQWKI